LSHPSIPALSMPHPRLAMLPASRQGQSFAGLSPLPSLLPSMPLTPHAPLHTKQTCNTFIGALDQSVPAKVTIDLARNLYDVPLRQSNPNLDLQKKHGR
jgi:hypothetical protein